MAEKPFLRFSDSRDPTLISYFNVSSRFWAARPIWLVQLSLLEASALVRLRTLRPPISYSQSRLCADRCLPGEIGAL
ncbi:hypothetical protein V2J09_008996 [Rumex salicifolius]